jgi:hypothetical protein
MKFSKEFVQYVEDSLSSQMDDIKFGETIEDISSPFYRVAPVIKVLDGVPIPVYGVFNRTTNLMEVETRQYQAARDWVSALSDLMAKQIEGTLEQTTLDFPDAEARQSTH